MTSRPDASPRAIELWGGVECTVNRVGGEYHDQMRWSGHDDRDDDLTAVAALGVSALRYPVLWERVAPARDGAPCWAWSDTRLARLRTLGIRPIVGLLHHGSGPRHTSLVDEAFPELFARYAGLVAQRYPWITDYTPINEPLTTARFSGLYGHWYPHGHDDRTFVRALLQQLRGVVLAMQAIRAVTPGARLIQTEDLGACAGSIDLRDQVAFESDRRWLTWDILSGRVDAAHPLHRYLLDHGATAAELETFCERPCPPDVVGVNYYVTSDRFLDSRLDAHPSDTHGSNGRSRYADVPAVRTPHGITGHQAHLLAVWRRYQRPVALTEVHLACTREEQVRWLRDAWQGAQGARDAGANVVAVTPWALFGSFDWDSLVTRPRGHYEPGAFDVRGGKPRLTAVGAMVSRLSRAATAAPPAGTGGPGWWTRPAGPAATETTAPLLIVGAHGTLGRALSAVAAQRGIRVRALGRAELDLTDPLAMDMALDEVRPWAVVNASGYVRVAHAELEPERCHDVNVAAAVRVARACEARGLRHVMYSSDLVFDGTAAREYVESDRPHPTTVYGHSKALAERHIAAASALALIIRTSAFFGPWDQANFATDVLAHISQGEVFRAPAQLVVTPTYVPHLAHATLDLLIDEAAGIWHLSNASPLSWMDFGREVAGACGFDAALVQPQLSDDDAPRQTALGTERGVLLPTLGDAVNDFARDYDRACLSAAVRS